MRFLALLMLFPLAACSGGGDDPDPPTGNGGSISISIAPASASIAQGGSGTAAVTLTRSGGFAGAVSLSVSGAPAGVTATAGSIAAGATSGTLMLQVGAAAAAGASTLTVRATGTGVSDATATFALTITAVQTGSFALSLSPTSLTVQQGASGQVTVNVARTAPFTGAVALAASGLPSGVTAAFSPTSATGATATLTLTAAATAATGTTTLTVRGTGTGVAEQSATLSLVVNPVSTGGEGTWRICGYETTPLWFAYQNGDGAWTRVQPSNGAYTFDITAARGGVAWVDEAAGGGYDLAILYSTGDEIRAQGEIRCSLGLGTNTVTGSVAGVGATETANISLGGAVAFVLPGSGSSFTLMNAPDGPVDLLASRLEQSFSGTTLNTIVRKLIIRRNVAVTDGATLPVLDFGSAEAFDPVVRTLTVNNLAGDQNVVSTWYQTDNGFVNNFFAGGLVTDATRSWYGVPADRQATGDLHALQVNAFAGGSNVTSLRNVLLYFREATDRTATLGPALSTPTMTTAATSPYVRFRAQLPVQSEYDQGWGFGWSQGGAGTVRSVVITATRGWAGSVTTLDLTVPDFSPVDGWDNLWGPRTGMQTQWSAGGTEVTGASLANPLVDGGVIQGATRIGFITP